MAAPLFIFSGFYTDLTNVIYRREKKIAHYTSWEPEVAAHVLSDQHFKPQTSPIYNNVKQKDTAVLSETLETPDAGYIYIYQ